MTTIESILKAARTSNYVHFPKGIAIFRFGSSWAVCICRTDKESISSLPPDATGSTPELAISALAKKLANLLETTADRHAKDAAESRATLLQLRGSEP